MASSYMDILLSPSHPMGPAATQVHWSDDYCDNYDALSQQSFTELKQVPLNYNNSTGECPINNTQSNLEGTALDYETDNEPSMTVCNHEYYTLLENVLSNLPKTLYIGKLLQLCDKKR
ncbi:hypothetical protein DPMN_028642 [Dreissena polymorpha]|uniref:Uncharacterized protein n=1 Tax=Dreissena polymorpha TaxID=45954 RepID=A0A9D4LZB2_DREPO|nr:hypothetical protein DPMN_028642 [Dreissena polymorpha]